MKRTLSMLAFVVLTIGLLGSCSKINERIDSLEGRVDGLESKEVVTIKSQIEDISRNIADLEAIRTDIRTLTATAESQGEDVTALKGKFTVNAQGKKVNFSQGNLVATIDASGAPTAWKFAANQYDCLGEGGANKTIGATAGDVDLFGWSTEATNNNWGIHSKTSATQDYTTGNFNDWGKAYCEKNSIAEDTWRTLSEDEWIYLFNNHFKKWATVNGVNGYVIAPDGFSGELSDTYADDAALVANNLVFLPAAGIRNASGVSSLTSMGCYWSSTEGSFPDYACDEWFNSDRTNFISTSDGRHCGSSVRLVTVGIQGNQGSGEEESKHVCIVNGGM